MAHLDRLLRSLMVIMTIYRIEHQRVTSESWDDLHERTLQLLYQLRSRAVGYADEVQRIQQQVIEAIEEVERKRR